MKDYKILKLLFKKYGHENVLFIDFDIAKYDHVCMMLGNASILPINDHNFDEIKVLVRWVDSLP